jgi:1-acyl-sn-glycerol-3-phosphate acyltransferase
MSKFSSFIFHRLMGWKLLGSFPEVSKCVVAVAPHTSWIDFPLGLVVRSMLGIQINYVGKKSLFRAPFGWFFRWTGGAPVDRGKQQDTVQAVADIFDSRQVFRLALAPEGTRKKVEKWRSGFYYIALRARVPIVLVAFDFGKKQVKISEPHTPTGDYEVDYAGYQKFYAGVRGYTPKYS